MESFIMLCNVIYHIVSILVNTWCFFTIDHKETMGLRELLDFDTALENSMSFQTDYWYPVIVILMSYQYVTFLRLVPHQIFYRLNILITSFSSIQAVLMKYMVSKRMRVVTEKVTESQTILELMSKTRQILRFNQKVNDIFSLRVANAVLSGMLSFLYFLAAFWRVYGTHKVMHNMEYQNPVLTIPLRTKVITELLFLAGISSKISNEVSLLIWEIDRRMINAEISVKYRKQLEIFMLELAHTPVHLTGMDLFTFDNSLITDVAAFSMSMMMIFVQFLT
ncbi:hypothetical protein J6590_084550 [Homalodisca vitripennis]|nr:hypothetical protein J6590_084550 [Homalodisca vitripennis]